MATDIQIEPPMNTTLNDRGDLSTVTGVEQAIQRAWLTAMNVSINWRGQPVTPERAADFSAAVADALRQDEQITAPVAVTVTDIDGSSIELTVDIGGQQFVVVA